MARAHPAGSGMRMFINLAGGAHRPPPPCGPSRARTSNLWTRDGVRPAREQRGRMRPACDGVGVDVHPVDSVGDIEVYAQPSGRTNTFIHTAAALMRSCIQI